jgi:hypothetical protein
VREQVEALEHHADLLALPDDVAFFHLVELAVALGVADQVTVDKDASAIDALNVVDATQQRGLSRPGWADQAGHLFAFHRQVDALEYL